MRVAISMAISDVLLCNDCGLLRPRGLVAATALAVSIWAPGLARANEPVAPASSQISLEELSATRDRPLFSPSRRPPVSNVAVVAPPPPPPPTQIAPPSPPPNLTFYGTFESPTEVGASVLIPPNDKPTIVRYGANIGGWRVVDISRHRLVLALDDRKAVFTLFTKSQDGEVPGGPGPQGGPRIHPPPSITPLPAPGSTTPR